MYFHTNRSGCRIFNVQKSAVSKQYFKNICPFNFRNETSGEKRGKPLRCQPKLRFQAILMSSYSNTTND